MALPLLLLVLGLVMATLMVLELGRALLMWRYQRIVSRRLHDEWRRT
jgi:hypothetical protein